MNSLSDKMARISGLSSDLSGIFREHRENVRKLTDASKTVKSLQYVVKLPQKLQVIMNNISAKLLFIYYNVFKSLIIFF